MFVRISYTKFLKQIVLSKKNSVSKLFWGRVQLQNAVALYQFQKEGSVQKLIHQLKYEGGKSVRVFLAK